MVYLDQVCLKSLGFCRSDGPLKEREMFSHYYLCLLLLLLPILKPYLGALFNAAGTTLYSITKSKTNICLSKLSKVTSTVL